MMMSCMIIVLVLCMPSIIFPLFWCFQDTCENKSNVLHVDVYFLKMENKNSVFNNILYVDGALNTMRIISVWPFLLLFRAGHCFYILQTKQMLFFSIMLNVPRCSNKGSHWSVQPSEFLGLLAEVIRNDSV